MPTPPPVDTARSLVITTTLSHTTEAGLATAATAARDLTTAAGFGSYDANFATRLGADSATQVSAPTIEVALELSVTFESDELARAVDAEALTAELARQNAEHGYEPSVALGVELTPSPPLPPSPSLPPAPPPNPPSPPAPPQP